MAKSGWPTTLPLVHGHVAKNTAAFFPLLPLTIRGVSDVSGLPLLGAGVLVSCVTGLTAMVAVWALVRQYAGARAADRATLLVAVFPATFVFNLVYAEGMTITLVALGLMALLRRRWLWAGILGMLATAASPVALAFVLSCAWCAWREIVENRAWRSLVAPVLAPLGMVGSLAWLGWRTGDLWAWHQTEAGGWHSVVSLRYPAHIVTAFVTSPRRDGDDPRGLAGTVLTGVCAVVPCATACPPRCSSTACPLRWWLPWCSRSACDRGSSCWRSPCWCRRHAPAWLGLGRDRVRLGCVALLADRLRDDLVRDLSLSAGQRVGVRSTVPWVGRDRSLAGQALDASCASRRAEDSSMIRFAPSTCTTMGSYPSSSSRSKSA